MKHELSHEQITSDQNPTSPPALAACLSLCMNVLATPIRRWLDGRGASSRIVRDQATRVARVTRTAPILRLGQGGDFTLDFFPARRGRLRLASTIPPDPSPALQGWASLLAAESLAHRQAKGLSPVCDQVARLSTRSDSPAFNRRAAAGVVPSTVANTLCPALETSYEPHSQATSHSRPDSRLADPSRLLPDHAGTRRRDRGSARSPCSSTSRP